jgi:hypothetical protein
MKNHRQNNTKITTQAVKKLRIETKQTKNQTIDPLVKQQVNSKHVNDYKIMAKYKKQKILENRRKVYEVIDKSKREKALGKNFRKNKEENIPEKKWVKYETLDQSKKEELLTEKMSYKKTIREQQNQKLLENKQAKYETMDPHQNNSFPNRKKGGWKRILKFMTLICTLISLKNKSKQVHFTYAVCVTEHDIKSR